MSNSNGVVSTEELIGKKSQKLSCVQLPSKSAFHSAAYFVGSAFSFMEHWAYQYSYIDMETFQNLNRNYFLFIHTLLSIYVGQIIKDYCIFESSGECYAFSKGIVEYIIKTIACFAMLVQLIDHSCQ